MKTPKTKKKVKKVKAWMILADKRPYDVSLVKPRWENFFGTFIFLPCTITYSLPKKPKLK